MSKLLIISGASKGIGLATAQYFVSRGYQVVNLSRSPCALPGVVNIEVDMLAAGWLEQCEPELLALTEAAEQICLVHNAAMMTKESVDDIDAAVLRQVLELNVVAAAQLNTKLLPKMQKGSSIIYISSTLGQKAVANTHSYVVSKHAVIGQMRATCQDLIGKQIHTACVCPGFTATEMLEEHLGKNPEVLKQITAKVILGRLIQPIEIAQTIWFCSQNPVINGATIDANLGQVES